MPLFSERSDESMKRTQQEHVPRRTILKIAVEAELDPRTVQRALEHGVNQMKSEYDRDRLRACAKKLGYAHLLKD